MRKRILPLVLCLLCLLPACASGGWKYKETVDAGKDAYVFEKGDWSLVYIPEYDDITGFAYGSFDKAAEMSIIEKSVLYRYTEDRSSTEIEDVEIYEKWDDKNLKAINFGKDAGVEFLVRIELYVKYTVNGAEKEALIKINFTDGFKEFLRKER